MVQKERKKETIEKNSFLIALFSWVGQKPLHLTDPFIKSIQLTKEELQIKRSRLDKRIKNFKKSMWSKQKKKI